MSDGNSKKDLRSYFKSIFAQKFEQELVQNQIQLNSVLRDFMSTQKGLWGAYRALPQEAGVEEVFQINQVDWVFPRVVRKDQEKGLEFCKSQNFKQGSFGIMEPDQDSVSVRVDQLQGILIPGLAFDRQGGRLGKGQGYYDRTLQSFRGIKVGICFGFQISKQPLPMEEHDIRLDFLMSDEGVINCRSTDHEKK